MPFRPLGSLRREARGHLSGASVRANVGRARLGIHTVDRKGAGTRCWQNLHAIETCREFRDQGQDLQQVSVFCAQNDA